jgi:MauM/NapG family ferredoxin protein
MKHIKSLAIARRLSQGLFLLVFIYILWSTTYPLTGLLPPDTFFKIDPLIMLATSISARLILTGLLFSLIMLVMTIIVGRFFCGWVCPLGAMLDLGGIFNKRYHENDMINARLRKVKYAILGIIAVIALFGTQVAWVLDPIVLVARFVSLNLIPAVTFTLNQLFVYLIRDLNMGGGIYDLYHSLRSSVLGVRIYFFSHSFIILAAFVALCALTFIKKRFWCRTLCPLGALYALVARYALLRRVVARCTHCGICKSRCRMGAIRDDMCYSKSECILCMDCVYDCPIHETYFTFSAHEQAQKGNEGISGASLSRKSFLLILGAGIFSLSGFRFRGDQMGEGGLTRKVIRPPAALPEDEFINRCVRCGNCMKVCITNGLQPVMLESGLAGLWTPQLVPETGYCEYSCTLCGNTCPTGAIRRLTLEEKHKTRLGLAHINRELCIPWAKGAECIVCQEHCPVADKAIKLAPETIGPRTISKPYVDSRLCIGCGICQNKCPVRPARAIRVSP